MPQRITRRRFLKSIAVSAITTAAPGVGSIVYATEIEPRALTVEHISLKLTRLDPAFNGYKVVQISDLHLDNIWMDESRLMGYMRLVNKQNPDMVAVTGDFVTHEAEPFADSIVKAMQALNPREATVAVLGNHDHWTNASVIQAAIRRSGIIDLNNAVHPITRGAARLYFCGVNDIWENYHRLDLVMNDLPDDGAAVLLAHEPDYADSSSATGRFDLQLSGHSHGGQVDLPVIGPLVLPPLGLKYPRGLYRVNNMLQYTNRGLGMVPPQVRMNCPPEITVLTLESHER